MASWGNKRGSFRGRRAQSRLNCRSIVRRIVLLLLLGGLLTGIWYGTRAAVVTITTIDVSGGKTVDVGAVEQEIQSILNGSYLFLIPKRFSYTYPHNAIITMLNRLSRVAEATVTRTSLTALSIMLAEYTPHALWCQRVASVTALETFDQCLFISEGGFAFEDAPSLQGTTLLRYVTEDRNPEIGTTFASGEYVHATKEFVQALMRRHGMYVYIITETKDGDVRYKIRGGGEILVSKNAHTEEVLENLDALLTSSEFKHIGSGNFVYIDLRFGNKVFVKEFADQNETETSATEVHTQATTGTME